MKLVKEFTFEAAHKVACFANNGHKCGRLHGHSYRAQIEVSGDVNEQTGILIDFFELKEIWAEVAAPYLDHNYLNEVPGLEIPTAENITRWIFNNLKPRIPLLSAVYLYEGTSDMVEYRG
jgi:queuosine biosynthesis protein QueD